MAMVAITAGGEAAVVIITAGAGVAATIMAGRIGGIVIDQYLGKGGFQGRLCRVAVQAMPIVQYFICVGSVLLTLLFFVDRNDPRAATAPRADVDRSILRIESAQRWPERIVFDSSAPGQLG